MQLQMTQKEKYFYGFLALAAVLMTIEYKYQPVAITVDVAHYAGERIGKGHPQTTAQVEPQAPRVAKTSANKVQTPKASNATAPLPQMTGQHTVAKGETLWSIARTQGISPKELLAANGMTRDTKLYPGQMVTIPK